MLQSEDSPFSPVLHSKSKYKSISIKIDLKYQKVLMLNGPFENISDDLLDCNYCCVNVSITTMLQL